MGITASRCLSGLVQSYVALVALSLAPSLCPSAVFAQDAAPSAAKQAYTKVIGAVVAVDADGKKLTVKEDSGTTSDVLLNESTSFMLVPPGEKDLRKATRIELKDLAPGDRVYARSRKGEGQEASPATSVIVMSKSDVAQHQEKSREEWQRRSVTGKVTAIDPAAKTITIATRSAGGVGTLAVQTDAQTKFRRYAPDSVKFADAQPSQFRDIDVGNNLRVLGEKNAEGTSVHAEELLSGSFRNIAGTVISVDAASNEIKVNDLTTKQPVTVKVNEDTNVRKLPPPMAMMIARMRGGAGAGASGAPAPDRGPVVPKGQGGPDSHPGFNGPAPAPGAVSGTPSGTDAPHHEGAEGGMGRSHMDINQVLERAPKIAVADLKPGDALVISSTNGSDPARVTAISVIAGVETILAAAPPSSRRSGNGQGAAGGAWTLEMGMPE